jgi:hypothetical protein
MTNRSNPSAAFWATVLVVALLFYVAMPGPIYWALEHELLPEWTWWPAIFVYTPLSELCGHLEPARLGMKWYVGLWTNDLPTLLSR